MHLACDQAATHQYADEYQEPTRVYEGVSEANCRANARGQGWTIQKKNGYTQKYEHDVLCPHCTRTLKASKDLLLGKRVKKKRVIKPKTCWDDMDYGQKTWIQHTLRHPNTQERFRGYYGDNDYYSWVTPEILKKFLVEQKEKENWPQADMPYDDPQFFIDGVAWIQKWA
jgi:hypothetical protein